MATIKSYTNLSQSKTLSKILPIESADMCWCNNSIKGINYTDEFSANLYTVKEMKNVFDEALVGWDKYWELIPCWSLVALLDIIKPINENTYTIRGTLDGGTTISFDEITNVMFQEGEIIDAVFEMIVWLKENEKI